MEQRLEQIISWAVERQAADIHLSVKGQVVHVMIRGLSGMEHWEQTDDLGLVRYIKYLAHLDVSQQYLPQSGVFEYYLDYQCYFIRVAVMQSYQNQSVVMRLLNQQRFRQLEDLTLDEGVLAQLRQVAMLHGGLVVLAGVTGSGKTTTAYALLREMGDRAVYSIEDPIEVFHEQFVQLQVNPLQQLSFDQAIKQVLRHDPDVIFIGEIRDEAEAKVAVRCALTGHLVVVTLHSGSAQGATWRLLDLGVSRYDLRNVLQVVIYQQMNYALREVDYAVVWQAELGLEN